MSQVASVRVSARQLFQNGFVWIALLLAVLGLRASHAQGVDPKNEELLPRPSLLTIPHPSPVGVPPVTIDAGQATLRPALPGRAELPSAHPNGSNPVVAPISFLSAPFASDGAPDVYGSYSGYLALSGDFAHTGHLDTVVFQGDGTLNYMANDGKGNFARKYVVVNPTFININNGRVADLNGDGYLDIVTACSSPVGFQVYLNNGDGTFAPAKFIALPPQTGPGTRLTGTYLNIADINSDGKLDIVASAYRYGQSGNTQAGTIYNMFFAGNGDGTFQSPIVGSTAYTGSSTGLRSVILADMNNDGKLDAVAAIWMQNSTTGAYTAYLSVGFGDGAGNFTKFGNPTATNAVFDSYYLDATLQAIDLNNDGKLDILWTPGLQFVYTSFGNGDGTLQDPNPSISAVNNIGSFTTGDFNKDGYPDIAIFIDGLVSVYQGLGNGSFSVNPVSQYANELAGKQPLVAQDFDGDGTVDLLIASGFRNQLSFLKGYGDGTFLAAPVVIPQNPGSSLPNNTENSTFINVDATGNWFGDGKFNLLAEEVAGGVDYLDYATQNGKNGFNFTRVLNLAQISGITAIEPVVGDFNNDGRDDFILALSDGIGLGLSNGDGTITRARTVFPISFNCGLSYVAVGDVNNDGNQDIVAAYAGDASCSGTGGVKSGFFVLLGDGAGNFKATFTPFGSQIYLPRLADLNHDGKLDLVLDDLSPAIPALYVIPGDGTGNFKAANARTILSGGGRINSFLLDDFNKDGLPDLTVLQSGISGATDNRQKGILTMVGNGDFTFQPQQFLYRGATGVGEAYSDFNQDKLPDLVVNLGLGGITVGGVAVYPNLGNGTFGTPVMLQSPAVSTGQANNFIFAGDFNGDGAPDILLGAGDGYVPNVLFPNAAGNQLLLVAGSATTTQYNTISISAATIAVGGQQPTGSVSFSSNGSPLGTAPLVSGISSISTASLALGTDTITAKYSGDALNYPSTASTVVTVTALAPSFILTGNTSTLSVSNGTPGQFTLNLLANQSFQGSVSFTCQGLPASVTCAFQPTAVTLAASGTATLNAVVTYNAQVAGLVEPRIGMSAAGIALAGMLGFFFPARRRKLLRLGLATVLVGGFLLTGLTGCSNSPAVDKTPYTANFNVVATGVSGGSPVVKSIPMSVSVQP